MGQLRIGHLVEAGLWLALCLFLYIYSFEFDKDIEIYKYGASSWPRAIILLMAIAAIGQLIHHWKRGDETSSKMVEAATDDGSEEAAHESHHDSVKWYLSTFALLLIPFAYMRVPDWIAAILSLEGNTAIHTIRVICAVILILLFVYYMRRNMVGAILTLPLFFATLLEDLGFYSIAPFFIIGVMFLFGERRPKPMVLIAALIFGLLMLLFVNILFVGLPVGNIRPFYDLGSWVVTVLQ